MLRGMVSYRRHSGFLVATVAAALLVPAAPPAAARSQSDAAESRPAYAAIGACTGGLKPAADGMCTHGGDPLPEHIRERGGPRTVSSLTPSAEGVAAVGCDNGTRGKRVQAIYAYVAGRTNRRATFLASFRTWAANVDAMFMNSAAQTGGSRRLRWVTTECQLRVIAVPVSPAA